VAPQGLTIKKPRAQEAKKGERERERERGCRREHANGDKGTKVPWTWSLLITLCINTIYIVLSKDGRKEGANTSNVA
jgi:hypothetical protein